MQLYTIVIEYNIEVSKHCKHVYEYVGFDVCPECGRYTHEPNHEFHNQLHRQWIADGKHLIMQCPLGGTIRGWWDI